MSVFSVVIITVQLLFVKATIVSVFSVVIVTVQLLFVEATNLSVFSAVVLNKLGEGAVMLNANACKVGVSMLTGWEQG